MNITDPIYADEDKAREHGDSLQATEPLIKAMVAGSSRRSAAAASMAPPPNPNRFRSRRFSSV
jgi:hypothetical protein